MVSSLSMDNYGSLNNAAGRKIIIIEPSSGRIVTIFKGFNYNRGCRIGIKGRVVVFSVKLIFSFAWD